MKMYEPGCNSVYTPLLHSRRNVPVPAPVTVGHGIPAPSISALVSRARSLARTIAARRSSRLSQMLGRALICVQAAKPECRVRGDGARKLERWRAWGHAAAMSADVDLDQHFDRRSGAMRGSRKLRDVATIVDQHTDFRRARKSREAVELAHAHDLVGDEHVADAGGDERLGLADFLATNADRAARHLQLRDLRTLVTLGVRAQPDTVPADRGRHRSEVTLQHIEIDDQRRRVNIGEPIADLGGHALCLCGSCPVHRAISVPLRQGGHVSIHPRAAPRQRSNVWERRRDAGAYRGRCTAADSPKEYAAPRRADYLGAAVSSAASCPYTTRATDRSCARSRLPDSA